MIALLFKKVKEREGCDMPKSIMIQTCQLARFCCESNNFLIFLTASQQDSHHSFLGKYHSAMKCYVVEEKNAEILLRLLGPV